MEYNEYAIGGKMIVARVAVPDNVMARDLSDEKARQEVRELLVQELASAILSKQLCEITQQREAHSYKTLIAARCYVAPDSTVKLLRT